MPPRVTKSTHIVAAMQPSIATAGHDDGGWSVSDFFAFNALFHNLGASQTWLSLASPEALVNEYGRYMHGNPLDNQKIVLSHELLQQDKITPVTVVREGEIIDQFLLEAKRATEAAKREQGQVLLLLFCQGVDNEHLALDCTGKKMLSVAALKDSLEPSVPVCLLASACFSGGWLVYPDLNTTKTTAISSKHTCSGPKSTFFRGRFPGSVFVGCVIGSLSGKKSELFDNQVGSASDNDKSHTRDPQSLQPDPATAEQVATYNAFCRSIWESCRGFHRRWHKHSFTFSAQGVGWEEPWDAMASITLENYKDRWDALSPFSYQGPAETRAALDPSPQNPNIQTDVREEVRPGGAEADLFIGPLTQKLHQNRLREMISLWQETCPGDRVRGFGPSMFGFMRGCAETGLPTDDEFEEEAPEYRYHVVAIIQYRLNMSLLAEDILEIVGLPRPGDKSCLMWEKYNWEIHTMRKFGISIDNVHQQGEPAYDYFWRTKLSQLIKPAAEQRPPFVRFQEYLVAAVVEAQLAVIERTRILEKIVACVEEAAEFYKSTALNDPEVKKRGRDWLKAIGQPDARGH